MRALTVYIFVGVSIAMKFNTINSSPVLNTTILNGQYLTFFGTTDKSVCAQHSAIYLSSDYKSVKCQCPKGYYFVPGHNYGESRCEKPCKSFIFERIHYNLIKHRRNY